MKFSLSDIGEEAAFRYRTYRLRKVSATMSYQIKLAMLLLFWLFFHIFEHRIHGTANLEYSTQYMHQLCVDNVTFPVLTLNAPMRWRFSALRESFNWIS
jgi:hypothetical protein